MPAFDSNAAQDAILAEMNRRGMVGGGQDVAWDWSVMGGPMRNIERRADEYRFHEPGNVGVNTQRALRELGALEVMSPYHYGPGMAGRPPWAN